MATLVALPLSPPVSSPSLNILYRGQPHSEYSGRTPDRLRRKRVDFSAHLEPISTPVDTIKFIPPSRESLPRSRSILKPQFNRPVYHRGSPAESELRDIPVTDEGMESLIQGLEDGDHVIRWDSYNTMLSLVRAHDDDEQELVLKRHLPIVMKSIKKDINRISDPDEDDVFANRLVTAALKLASYLVWHPKFAPALAEEHRVFLLERSIQALQERTCSKTIALHYLHLLGTQDFRPQLLVTNNRAARILDLLPTVTEHYPGGSVSAHRLMIYTRLLDQAPGTMQSKCMSWVPELLTCIGSPSKDIRSRAITLGFKLSAAVSQLASISKHILQILDQETEDGRTTSSHLCKRLHRMSADPDTAVDVPRIWSIMLCLITFEQPIEKWSHLKDWLKVIQYSFNSSDIPTRAAAYTAWDRFVVAARPSEASTGISSVLTKPILASLERRSEGIQSHTTRSSAISSYCNLLFYAFRPSNTAKHYTRGWNEYVVKVINSKFLKANPSNVNFACEVLSNLFWKTGNTTKIWNSNRVLRGEPMAPAELPTISCKWLRAHTDSVIDLLEAVLRQCSFSTSQDDGSGSGEKSLFFVTWTSFVRALAESCCREIKPSTETKNAIQHIREFILRVGEQYEGPTVADTLRQIFEPLEGTADPRREGPDGTRTMEDITSNTNVRPQATAQLSRSPRATAEIMPLAEEHRSAEDATADVAEEVVETTTHLTRLDSEQAHEREFAIDPGCEPNPAPVEACEIAADIRPSEELHAEFAPEDEAALDDDPADTEPLQQSDENEELAASQLSNDLSSHLALKRPSSPDVEMTEAKRRKTGGEDGETIMQSLRAALGLLRYVRAAEVDLRKIDDMCFEIRVEAQRASERP